MLRKLIFWPCVMPLLFVFGFCAAIYWLLLQVFSPLVVQPIVRFICRLILLSAGQRLKIEGEYPSLENGRYVYAVFGHGSLLDAFVLGATLRGRFTAVAAVEYFWIPFWRGIMKSHGIVPLQRKIHDAAMKAMADAEDMIRLGYSLMGLVEGTRTKDGSLGEIKRGLFYGALHTNTQVVPMLISGSFGALDIGRNIRPGVITIRIGKPIQPPAPKSTSVTLDGIRADERERVDWLIDTSRSRLGIKKVA